MIFLSVAIKNSPFNQLQSLLQELGLNVSQKQLVSPSTKVVCLGILVIQRSAQFQFPLKNWLSPNNYVSNDLPRPYAQRKNYNHC